MNRSIAFTPAPTLALDTRRLTAIGWYVIGVGLTGFLLWAGFAPLDKGVPVPGTVTVAGNRKTVQHPGGGIVDEILVRDGDRVSAGQVLLRMNETQARADAESLRIQYRTALATEARLLAERDGSDEISFAPELLDARDTQVTEAMSTQRQLFVSRRRLLTHEMASLRESVAGAEAQLGGLHATRARKSVQLQALGERRNAMREVVAKGFVARAQLLELEAQYAEVDSELAEIEGRVGQLKRQLGELRERALMLQEEHHRDVRAELSDAQLNSQALGHKLRAAEFTLGNANVRAPVSGTVVGLSVFTPGGYVTAGLPLLDIVPADQPLQVEAQVPVNLIDKVEPGLAVELQFTAFNQSRTPHVPAIVERVSADRLVDEVSGAPYYRVLATVTTEGMQRLGGLGVRPGMPVETFIKTGERSLLSYLFKPIADRASTALTEE